MSLAYYLLITLLRGHQHQTNRGRNVKQKIKQIYAANQFSFCSIVDIQFQKPGLCCVWMRTVYLLSAGELCVSPCFCSYTWEGKRDTESPPAVVVYVHRARTNWLVLNLCSALWPPGSKWSSCGAFGPWQKMEPLTHSVICGCDARESKPVATEQR